MTPRLLLTLGLLCTLLAGHLNAAPAPATPGGDGVLVDINGPIGPAVSSHVVRAIQHAEAEDKSLLILRLDTPGGLDSAMRDMIKAILNSSVPIVGFVAPSGARAASAGTYLLYATHIAAMAPATNLGAATPIPVAAPGMPSLPSPEGPGEDGAASNPANAAETKMRNDAVAYIRSLAELRDRNADWAERAVREGVSLTAAEALDKQVIDLIAGDLQALLTALDGRAVTVGGKTTILHTAAIHLEQIEADWRTRLLAIITNPSVAYMLMMIGIYGLLLEGYNPGGIVPGVVGAISLLLALFAFQVLPVNYAGFALILLGVGLILAEAFVPSFGILGLGGLAAFVFGSIMLMDTGVPGYQLPVAAIAATATAGALVIAATVFLLLRARHSVVVTGSEVLLGANVEAMEDFEADATGYSGRVWLAGESWHAHSDTPVKQGQTLIVTQREGLTVIVKPH